MTVVESSVHARVEVDFEMANATLTALPGVFERRKHILSVLLNFLSCEMFLDDVLDVGVTVEVHASKLLSSTGGLAGKHSYFVF